MQSGSMILTGESKALTRVTIKPAFMELATISTLILSYVWLWQGTFEGDGVVVALLFLALAILSHRRRGDSARDLGFRLDNLGRSIATVGLIALTVIVLVIGLGLVLDSYRRIPIPRPTSWLLTLGLFGIVQQYALLGVYYRLFDEVILDSRLVPSLTAAVFALFHLPNLPLTLATFAAGVLACTFYRRARNLWILGISHALISAVFSLSFDKLLVVGMKVGLRALV